MWTITIVDGVLAIGAAIVGVLSLAQNTGLAFSLVWLVIAIGLGSLAAGFGSGCVRVLPDYIVLRSMFHLKVWPRAEVTNWSVHKIRNRPFVTVAAQLADGHLLAFGLLQRLPGDKAMIALSNQAIGLGRGSRPLNSWSDVHPIWSDGFAKRPANISRLRTNRLPAEVGWALLDLINAARDGDADKLRSLLIDSSVLLSETNKRQSAVMSGAMTGMLYAQANGPDADSPVSSDAFFEYVVDVAEQLPIHVDEPLLRQLMDQITGTAPLDRTVYASGFDIQSLACHVAVQGAAARKAAMPDSLVLALFRASRYLYEHSLGK
jgi:hypothetical protein